MAKIAIIHPWLPQYRLPFFALLLKKAALAGHDVRIFHGAVPPEWQARGDAVEVPAVATMLPTRWIGVGRFKLALRSLRPLRRSGQFDLIVVEQAVRNLETYRLMLSAGVPRLAMWGHGRTFTKPTGRFQEAFKLALTRRVDWFFAYTKGGADHIASKGYPEGRTTVVFNTIDSAGLAAAVNGVDEQALVDFKASHALHKHTAVFIGGLDSSKRLDFLLSAGDAVALTHPTFKLLIIGEGDLGGWLAEQAKSRSWVVLLGHATGEVKAKSLAAARAIVMPGRVGLVSVDSFAAAVPLVTTDYRWHAPEFEYLHAGENAIVTANDVASFSAGIISLLDDDDLQRRLANECRVNATAFSVDAMVDRFVQGLEQASRVRPQPRAFYLRRLRSAVSCR